MGRGLPRQRSLRRRTPAPRGDLNVEVGRRLRALREARGMTGAQLAGDHYTRARVSAIETGAIAGSLAALLYYAQRLGVSLRDLLPDQEPGPPIP